MRQETTKVCHRAFWLPWGMRPQGWSWPKTGPWTLLSCKTMSPGGWGRMSWRSHQTKWVESSSTDSSWTGEGGTGKKSNSPLKGYKKHLIFQWKCLYTFLFYKTYTEIIWIKKRWCTRPGSNNNVIYLQILSSCYLPLHALPCGQCLCYQHLGWLCQGQQGMSLYPCPMYKKPRHTDLIFLLSPLTIGCWGEWLCSVTENEWEFLFKW